MNSPASSAFEQPIKVPGSPFWTVFRRFGRDELIALFISVVGTAVLSVFTSSPIVLALTGPVIEKIGFFPAHFKEAYDVYRSTPRDRRHSLGHYVRRAFKGSLTSLLEDVLIHDPLYIGGVFFGLLIYPSVPAWLLAAVSFVTAVVIVAALEVAYTEVRYRLFARKLKRLGFGSESYYESRFFVAKKVAPVDVLRTIAERFSLDQEDSRTYKDTYWENTIPAFSGRTPKLRWRNRTSPGNDEYKPSVQVTFTRSYELSKKYDQYRFFPIRKDKFFLLTSRTASYTDRTVPDQKCRSLIDQFRLASSTWQVDFERYVVRDNELFVSADVFEDRDYYILEFKVHKDVRRLETAMRFVMQEFPVQQTTHAKSDI